MIAAACGFCAFALAIGTGIAAQNDASTILWRAIVALFVAQLVGIIIGRAVEVAVNEHTRAYAVTNPIESESQSGSADGPAQPEQPEHPGIVGEEQRAAA